MCIKFNNSLIKFHTFYYIFYLMPLLCKFHYVIIKIIILTISLNFLNFIIII